MAEIMDVSRHQGTINWEKVKASGKVVKNYTGHRLIWKIPCMKTVIHPYRD